MSQSSNDTFPTALHIAAVSAIEDQLFPAMDHMIDVLKKLEKENEGIIKVVVPICKMPYRLVSGKKSAVGERW